MVKNIQLTKQIRLRKADINRYRKAIASEQKKKTSSLKLIAMWRGKIARRQAVISNLNSMLVLQGGQRI